MRRDASRHDTLMTTRQQSWAIVVVVVNVGAELRQTTENIYLKLEIKPLSPGPLPASLWPGNNALDTGLEQRPANAGQFSGMGRGQTKNLRTEIIAVRVLKI